jgi:hypothetical protein
MEETVGHSCVAAKYDKAREEYSAIENHLGIEQQQQQ